MIKEFIFAPVQYIIYIEYDYDHVDIQSIILFNIVWILCKRQNNSDFSFL